MQDPDLSMRDLFTVGAFARRFVIVGGLIASAVAWQLAHGAVFSVVPVYLHVPHLGLLAQAGAVIELHVAAAMVALLVGTFLLLRRKGTWWHRRLGWAWVIAMATVALSSFFIQVLNPGHWSFIHLISGWVVIALPLAVFAIRRGNVRRHRRTMTGIFIGGLLIAGLFTFAPGRLMFRIFLG